MTKHFPRWLKRGPIRPEEYVGSDEARNEQVVRTSFGVKAKRYLRMIPMAAEVVAMYFCLLDAATPIWVKATAAAALAYFILPFDAVPDFLPIVGLGDAVAQRKIEVEADSVSWILARGQLFESL